MLWCTCVMMQCSTLSKKGAPWYVAGTAHYVLEQGTEYLMDDLPNTTSIEDSAADCAHRCRQYTGTPGCTAWTWHHPTAAAQAYSCHLKAHQPDSLLKVRRNPQAVSGSLLGETRTEHASLHALHAAEVTFKQSCQVLSCMYKHTPFPCLSVWHLLTTGVHV
jgi:hypothetical protein